MLSSKAKRELKIDQRQVLIESIEIGISSPQQIYLRGSRQLPNGKTVGLIKNSKTVNYKKFTPFRDGLFCERIFGPVTSLVCACGKKQPHSKITFCEKCEVEYIDQRSRRYRLGYISLLSPVTHIWYLKGRPSYLSLFLGKRKKTVVSLAYCNGYLMDHIVSQKEDELQYKGVIPRKYQKDQSKLLLACKSSYKYKAKLLDPQGGTTTFGHHLRFVRRSAFAMSPFRGQGKKGMQIFDLHRDEGLVRQRSAAKTVTLGRTNQTTDMDRIVRKRLSVSDLSKKDCLLRNNDYKSKPFIKSCIQKKFAPTIYNPMVQTVSNKITASAFCKAIKKGLNVEKSNTHINGPSNAKRSFVRRFDALAKQERTNLTAYVNKRNGKANLIDMPLQFDGMQSKALRGVTFDEAKLSWASPKCISKRPSASLYKNICTTPMQIFDLHGHGKQRVTNFLARVLAKNPQLRFAKRFDALAQQKRTTLQFVRDAKRFPMAKARRLSKSWLKNRNDFSRPTSYGKYCYTRQQCLPFLPSFVSHFYLRDALLNFLYSSPISEDIPILEYCNTTRIEPLQDVHKFMARQTVDKFKNGYLSVKRINSSFDSFLPKIHRKRRSVANLSIAERCGEPQAPSCKRVRVSAISPSIVTNNRLAIRAYAGVPTKTNNVSRTFNFAFRRKIPYQEKKHVYLNSFFKKIGKQNTLNSTNDLINKKEETHNTTLSNLELTAIREILSYTGGGAIQQLLKQFDPHDLCKFLVAERQILRALYQKHIAFKRDYVDKPMGEAVQSVADDRRSTLLLRKSTPPNGGIKSPYKSKMMTDGFVTNAPNSRPSSSSDSRPQANLRFATPLGESGEKVGLPSANASTNLRFVRRFAWGLEEGLQIEDLRLPAAKSARQSTCKLTQRGQSNPRSFASLQSNDRSLQSNEASPTQQGFCVGFNKEAVSESILNGLPLKEKRLVWELDNKKTQLYQKKEIMRISRRIYKVARRLKVAQLLTLNHRRPEWMILSHLPVLPPDLRPILQMSEKVIVASDLNIMYQRVIYRNNRHLRVRFIDFQLVTAIQRLVQDAVDRLMENGKGGSKPYYTQGGRPLKSLSDILKGKKGRFRLNLLGKRVDFSGRSVIVVAPSLKIHECGLPKDIALELYHYFLLRQLIVKKYCASIVTAKKMIKSKSAEMWDVLREVMYHHPVLLNRAPTLHRLGIQAFQPKLVVGNAIWLHPLVCSGFNADFDGDQMGVHLPLSFAARAESWDLLWSRNNLLSPATGQPMLVPSQDMVLGFYYMTALAPKGMTFGQRKVFSNLKRFKTARITYEKGVNKAIVFLNSKLIITNYQNGILKLHTPVWLYWDGKIENENNSATPFELRISGFGAQRHVYENYILNSLFSGNASAWSIKSSVPSVCPKGIPRICNGMPIDSLQSQNVGESSDFRSYKSSYKTKFIDMSRKKQKGESATQKASFIFTQPKASYVRTTAGRVLMNNILIKN